MAKVSGKKVAFWFAVVLFLAIVVPPFINVNRYRARIVDSISNAIGRPVSIGSVSLRILPQPGFDLENIVIGDDPSISAEPILRADSVTASLRLSSLWRGRLEIAKLSFSYPSLNLVRAPDGHWNIESLLWKAARTPVAPTTAPRPENRRRFPYIEAENGRINFQFGLVKSVFSFTDADFALWSPAENEWRMRLEARPVRTDTNITDTGTVRAEGSFHRAEYLRDTPLNLKVAWQHGQLGQVSKLITGHDRGWRGGVDFSATFRGKPSKLQVVADTGVSDFRRYDIVYGEAMNLFARCSGTFDLGRAELHGFQCQAPVGGSGSLTVSGSINGLNASSYDIGIAAENIPANAIVALARHAKRDLPIDLSGTGTLVAAMSLHKTAPGKRPTLVGDGAGIDLALHSSVLGPDLKIGRIQLEFGSPARSTLRVHHLFPELPSAEPGRIIGTSTFAVPLSSGPPALANGWVSPNGYAIRIKGEAEILRLVQVGRALGIAVPKIGTYGSANINLDISGKWVGLPRPSVSGTARLKSARAEVPGIASPIQIASSDIEFSGDNFSLSNIVAQVGPIKFTGHAKFPRQCFQSEPCIPQLDLQAEELNVDQLNALFNPRLKKRPWYRLFGSSSEDTLIPRLQAFGRVSARRFSVGPLVTAHTSVDFQLDKGTLRLQNLRADMLGGAQSSQWTVNFGSNTPTYSGTGNVTNIHVAQLAALGKRSWGTGILSGQFEIVFSGWTQNDIEDSAKGSASLDWRNGVLRTVALNGHSPLHFTHFVARVEYESGKLRVMDSRMQAGPVVYFVSGTASAGHELEMQFQREHGPAYKVTGPVQKPQIVEVNRGAQTAERK